MSHEHRRSHWFDEDDEDISWTTAEEHVVDISFERTTAMVELKGPGYTSNYNNVMIIIPAIIIVTLMSYLGYRLVDSLRSKKRSKEEKARLKQQKKADRQSSPQPASPGKNKQK